MMISFVMVWFGSWAFVRSFRADVNYLTERQNTTHNPSMPTIPQRDLYRMINEAGERGERVVVATVAHTRGSAPQQRGAKMVFFQNGETAGTVGGGCIEAEVWAEAQTAMRSGNP